MVVVVEMTETAEVIVSTHSGIRGLIQSVWLLRSINRVRRYGDGLRGLIQSVWLPIIIIRVRRCI